MAAAAPALLLTPHHHRPCLVTPTAHTLQVPGLREAEPDLAKQIDAAMATIAANGAAATAAAESLASAAQAAKAAEAAGGGVNSAAAAAAFGSTAFGSAAGRSREGNAAGFPTAMPATPANPNALFSTINAETLETSAQNVSFPVPEDKVRQRVVWCGVDGVESGGALGWGA